MARTIRSDHTLLQAVSLCSDCNLGELQTFVAQESDILHTELVLRILLTFLSAAAEPAAYLPLLQALSRNQLKDSIDDLHPIADIHAIHDLSAKEAAKRVRRLHLLSLDASEHSTGGSNDGDLLARFLVQRAYQIDRETGNLVLILQLIEPFIDQFESLRRWLISRLLPLLRLDYQFYPETPTALSIIDFESLDAKAAIGILLQRAKEVDNGQNVGRDLRELVGPWMYGSTPSKRRKLGSSDQKPSTLSAEQEQQEWQAVNEWLLQENLTLAVTILKTWRGPEDVDLGGYGEVKYSEENTLYLRSRYSQAAYATIYAQRTGSETILKEAWEISDRVAEIMPFRLTDDRSLPSHQLQLCTYSSWVGEENASSLRYASLLMPSNRLTVPSLENFQFLRALLRSAQILESLHHIMPIAALAELSLFAGKDTQQQELRKILQNLAKAKSSTFNWRLVYDQISWLRCWRPRISQSGPKENFERALFWQVDQQFVDTEFLTTLITAGQHELAIELYLNPPSTSLPPSDCETIIEACIYSSYDNASNGNRNRGSIKRASDILKAFLPHLPQSQPLQRIEPLLAATHSLSFYHLTLEHGVPFQPVSIRVHPDPISLIEKVLEQNPTAYTKLDDLLSIGQNFVAAGLPAHEHSISRRLSFSSSTASPNSPRAASNPDLQSSFLIASQRIISLAINSALSPPAHDFDTAYSYVMLRLNPSPSPSPFSPQQASNSSTWQAAYTAGRYRPPSTPTPPPLHTQITSLSKRMELLSHALILTPDPAVLPEILATWRRCEEELATLREQESREEDAWDERAEVGVGETAMPGEWDWDTGRKGDQRDESRLRAARERERETRNMQGRRERERGRGKGRGNGEEEEVEAPMGLFEVARAAVGAVGKSAFPLRAGGGAGEGGVRGVASEVRDKEVGAEDVREEEEEEGVGRGGEGEGERERVRKRDVVSSMVTGGLVKGVGWMLGAEPAGAGAGAGAAEEK